MSAHRSNGVGKIRVRLDLSQRVSTPRPAKCFPGAIPSRYTILVPGRARVLCSGFNQRMPHEVYRILIVGDSEAERFLMNQAFAECGTPCKLMLAASFEESIALLKSDGPFDLVLSDLAIGSDKAALVKAVRADSKSSLTPVIVLSRMHDPNAAYEAGANAFIVKPIDLDGLFQSIRILMDFWTKAATLPPAPGLPRRSHHT